LGREIQSLRFFTKGGMLMTKMPEFLPPILDLRGTWEEILERLYAIFYRDFKRGTVHHRG
jgi:hypothetical protein